MWRAHLPQSSLCQPGRQKIEGRLVPALFWFLWGGDRNRPALLCPQPISFGSDKTRRQNRFWENERLRVQQVCSGATEAGQLFSDSLCLAAHKTCASYEGYSISFGSDKTRRQNRCPSCAGIISSCHLWGLGGGGQLLSPSPALHVESSPPFSLQTARLA